MRVPEGKMLWKPAQVNKLLEVYDGLVWSNTHAYFFVFGGFVIGALFMYLAMR